MASSKTVVTLLALLAALLCTCSAQNSPSIGRCEVWAGSPPFCGAVFNTSGFGNYSVFVNASSNQAAQAAQIAPLNATFAFFPKPCADLLIKIYCLLALQPCVGTAIPGVPAQATGLLSLPCQSLCQRFNQVCNTTLLISGNTRLALNCSTTVALLGGQPAFPAVATRFDYQFSGNNFTSIVPCNDLSNITDVPYFPYLTCQAPLKFNPNAFNNNATSPPCQPPCPSFVFSDGQWTDVKILMSIVGWFGWAMTIFVGITQVLIPKNRRYPGSAALCMTLSANMLSFAFVFGSCYGWQRIWCEDDFTESTFSNGACVFQGTWILFWGLAASFWWATIAVNTFLVLSVRIKPNALIFLILSHGICWGYPLIAIIIALSAKKITYYTTSPICFINRDDNGWWQYGLFYIIIGILIIAGIICMAFVLWEMRNINDSSKGKRAKYYKQLRVLFFLFVFLYIFSFIFAYRFVITAHEDSYTAAGTAYAVCLYANDPTRTCELTDGLSYSLWMNFAFTISGQGILIALLWGTTEEILFFWAIRIRNLIEGKSFFSGVAAGSSSTASSSSSRTSQSMQNAPENDDDSYDGAVEG